MSPQLSFGREGQGPLVEWETHYHLGDREFHAGLGSALDPLAADLVDVAVGAYVTDRLNRRRPLRARDTGQDWERTLGFQVAVRRPNVWARLSVQAALHDVLGYLTDDTWRVTFNRGGPRYPRRADTQPTLFDEPLDQPAQAALLSGGLDSLLGAASDLEGPGELLLVSTATFPKLRRQQQDLAGGLDEAFSRRVRHLAVPVNLTAEGKALGDGIQPAHSRVPVSYLWDCGCAHRPLHRAACV